MKIELYSYDDIHAKAIKIFLERNNLPFKEIPVNNESIMEIQKPEYYNKGVSFLKITKSSSITLINGFNELMLNQLLEHITKYKPKLEL